MVHHLDPYREELEMYFLVQGLTFEQICITLQADYNMKVSVSTVKRRFREWDIRKNSRLLAEHRAYVETHLVDLMMDKYKDDKVIHKRMLEDGIAISYRKLKEVRRGLGDAYFRRHTIEQNEARYDEVRALLLQLLDDQQITLFGRKLVKQTLQQEYGYVTGGAWSYAIYKELYPEGVEARRRKEHRPPPPHREPFLGPDHFWSIDAYCKFEHFGFGIYAAIDAYSRNVQWVHCGISSRTELSVGMQYLYKLREYGYRPRLIRSDRGTETIWLADIQHALCTITHRQETQDRFAEPEFHHGYKYGTGKANVDSEKWWYQLSKSALMKWRV
jgi:hypothetical protein